ncbi:glycosyltransferase [Parabacteroides sp. OttesenSCG-928-N08]|nr:glycosyltransferase [Parabacteroides sp. OttesenSCG-928-N08]
MFYSLIIPIYNRPEEMEELLASLTQQQYRDFEIIVVEDGSTLPCREVVARYEERLSIRYFTKPNSGPGPSRNYGAQHAKGDYLLFVDSDCILPPEYLSEIEKALQDNPTDLFGGSDRAAKSFNALQQAISFSMTSLLTTGGIRGSQRRVDHFYPRSFNMGIRREVFEQIGGFPPHSFGEDMDLSIRLIRAGYSSSYFAGPFVYHKRRATWRSFFRQVKHFGEGRLYLSFTYPFTFRIYHLMPSLFTLYLLLAVVAGFWLPWLWAPLALLVLLLGADALIKTKSLHIALLSIFASFVQLVGYGSGFLLALVRLLTGGKNVTQRD